MKLKAKQNTERNTKAGQLVEAGLFDQLSSPAKQFCGHSEKKKILQATQSHVLILPCSCKSATATAAWPGLNHPPAPQARVSKKNTRPR